MRFFAIGIEDAHVVTVKRPQRCNARKPDRAAMLGRHRQHLGRRQDGRRAAFSCRNGFDKVRYRLAQDANSAPSSSTISSAKCRDQDTTQLRNRTGIQADAGQMVPGKIARLPKREGPSTGACCGRLYSTVPDGRPGMDL
jgi:hypothetical protein